MTNTTNKATTTETQNNGWEKIAKENLKNAYNWNVGEREIARDDGDMTEENFNKWITEEALNEVYHEAITTLYTGDSCGGEAPKEMRFAGKEFCYKYLISLFKKDGYTVTAPEAKPKTKKATTKKATKTQKTVQAILKAFTGMNIGTYTAEVTKSGYKITTKKGIVIEFNKDGTQKVDCKNPRFNNRLEIVTEA